MHRLIAVVLILVHRVVDARPRLHRRLVSLVNRSVGERRVDAAVVELTHAGDVVWDVGANVGWYTRRFLEQVGPGGHVVAVEPVPANARRLALLAESERLTVLQAALATTDGRASFAVSGENGETSCIDGASGPLDVRVARGDTLAEQGVPRPQVVKIDVEGFEGDVLDGMGTLLADVRGVVVEVHFAALAQRGRRREPLRLMHVLRRDGFTVRWVDPSHLLARR